MDRGHIVQTPPQPPPNVAPARVLVFRALQVGDMLCAVPALRALRASLPAARITLAGLPWARQFAARFQDYIDDFIECPGWPGLPERPPDLAAIPEFLATIRKQRFDFAIQMHGSGRVTNALVAQFGARGVAGFYSAGKWRPNDHLFLAYPENEPEVRRHLRLMEHLGFRPRGEHLEFPLLPGDYHDLDTVEGTSMLAPGSYACLHPGARSPARRWLPERFAEVGDALARQGLRVVITGSAAEADLADTVARAMRAPALNLARDPRLSLGALAALLRWSRLLVCNDTGVSHIAGALGIPSVVVYTASDPHRWAPAGGLHEAVWHDVECRPCDFRECPIGHPCAHGIPAESVLKRARALLAREREQSLPPGQGAGSTRVIPALAA